jgi:ankyrin repeat protein
MQMLIMRNVLCETALMLASENGHKEIVELLINKNANVNYAKNNGNTALMLASKEWS